MRVEDRELVALVLQEPDFGVDLERAGLWAARPWLILRTDTRELAAWRLDNGSATPIELA